MPWSQVCPLVRNVKVPGNTLRPIKILHVGPDTQFLQFAAKVFESVAPGANEYIVATESDDRNLRFPIPDGTVHIVSAHPRGVIDAFVRLPDCDMIVAHGMTTHSAAAFARAHRRVVTVWSGWGFDYYGTDKSSNDGLLGELTLSLSRSLEVRPSHRGRIVRALKSRLWHPITSMLTRHAAARANYFSAPLPSDELVFRDRFPEFKGLYHQLSYASLGDTFASGDIPNNGPRGILVGNSASFTNNHLEAFELLAGLDIGSRKVVVPLSYGEPAYRDAILARGRELFGSAFSPLVDRLPLDNYLALVANCDVVIMNHKRQQGLGNIGAALYNGAHVFLDEKNPAFAFLQSRGATIYSTAEIVNKGLPLQPATAQEVSNNRLALESFWGADQVVKNVEALVAQLNLADHF